MIKNNEAHKQSSLNIKTKNAFERFSCISFCFKPPRNKKRNQQVLFSFWVQEKNQKLNKVQTLDQEIYTNKILIA